MALFICLCAVLWEKLRDFVKKCFLPMPLKQSEACLREMFKRRT